MADSKEQNNPKSPGRFGVRHVQIFLIFLCFIIHFMSRLNASFAIVAMTDAESANPDFPEYKWNEKEISYILSSANVGYLLSLIPGGFMCRKFGSKITLAFSMLGASLLGLITPSCIPFGGWKIYSAIRTIQGVFQGLLMPCYSNHLAHWAPPAEITRFGAFCLNGVSIATVLAMLTSGFIAKSSLGWPGISYFAGGSGIIWCVIWQIFADDTPAVSRFISPDEKYFILLSQKKKENGAQRKIPVPWKSIFTSRPFWSLLVVQIATNWGQCTILYEIPLYMRGVLQMEIRSNAIFSSIPFMASFVMSFVYVYLLEILVKKKITSLTVSKKILNTIAMWIPAIGLIGVGYLDVNQRELAILFMVIIVGINSGTAIGNGMNANELSPNHAAILVSLIFTLRFAVAIFLPLVVGIIVSDETNRSQWQIVFLIAGVSNFVGNLQYLFWGTTSKQPWNAEDFLISTCSQDAERQTKHETDREDLKRELNELIEKPITAPKQ